MAADRSAWTDQLEATWRVAAAGVLPELFQEMRYAGVYKTFQYDSYSDLDSDELETELALILRRPVSDDDVRQFKVLIELAEGAACRKRQRVNSWVSRLGDMAVVVPA